MTSRMTHQMQSLMVTRSKHGIANSVKGSLLGIKTMKMKMSKVRCFLTGLMLISCLSGLVKAETQYTYNIKVDAAGDFISGSGTGYLNSWYYYPSVDQYVMWFDNGEFEDNTSVKTKLGVTVSPISTALTSFSYDTDYCWSTDKWSDAGDSTPPLPDDVQDSTTFSKYISTSSFFSATRSTAIGTVSHSNQLKTIRGYNPAWIGFMVAGSNATMGHTIVLGVEDDTSTPDPTGACCNESTGSCTITTMANCAYTWLGAGTTCSSCNSSTYTYDYGDAPATYPVLEADNGAKHYMIEGFCLGSIISAEPDGQPSVAANLDDDDGVEFPTDLVTGSLATIDITATTSLGLLSAWMDFNGDGDWEDENERLFTDVQLSAGTNSLTTLIPSTAKPGTSYARFRYSTNSGLSVYGTATDGEVEDYLVVIKSPDTDIPTLPFGAHLPNRVYSPITSQIPLILDEVNGTMLGYACGSLYEEGPIIADDWTARDALPLMGVRWWGIFDNWTDASLPADAPTGFHIAVWSNNSTEQVPRKMLWEQTVTEPAISNAGIIDTSSGMYSDEEIGSDEELPLHHSVCFEFATLFSQEDWFYPENAGATYWLSISAIYDSTPTYTWSWLSADATNGLTAQQILGTTSTWPPTIGSIVDTESLISNWDVTFEPITSEGNPSYNLYDGWLGDLNGDGVADQKDFEDLIKLFVL